LVAQPEAKEPIRPDGGLQRRPRCSQNKAEADMVAGIEASTQAYAKAQWIVIGFALGSIALALALGYAISTETLAGSPRANCESWRAI